MTANGPIRRILVALDATAESLAALDAAADLAEGLQADLLGVFVEEIDLLNLAALPIGREIDLSGGLVSDLDSRSVERQFKVQTAKARAALEQVAERRQLAWTFRTVRGNAAGELLKAAPEVDLLTLGKGGFPLTKRSRLGSTARAVANAGHHTLIVAGNGHGREIAVPPVVVFYDGSACAEIALGIAARIASTGAGALAVLLLADDNTDPQLEERAATVLTQCGTEGLSVTYRPLKNLDEASLVRGTTPIGDASLVVAGGDSAAFSSAAVVRLLEATTSAVMLIKPHPDSEC